MATNRLDVAVIGSINTDLSVYTHSMPSAGETVMGANFIMGFGGKGANQCVATQFLGSKSAIVGKVGYDCFGDEYLEHLKKISVNTRGITRTREASTGSAFITVQVDRGENQIIVVPGSNMLLSKADVDNAAKDGFLDAHVVVCQFEISGDTTLYALEQARKNNRITVLNPAPPPSKAPGNAELLPKMLPLCDYCCPNETEALELISAVEKKDEVSETEQNTFERYTKCLCWLAEHGVRHPIVTMGSQGLLALVVKSAVPKDLTEDVSVVKEVTVMDEAKAVVHVRAPPVAKVVDTTGAGDCFVGAFVHFLACHQSLGMVEQLRRAVWVASKSVQAVGTQSSFPKRSALPSELFQPGVFHWPDQ